MHYNWSFIRCITYALNGNYIAHHIAEECHTNVSHQNLSRYAHTVKCNNALTNHIEHNTVHRSFSSSGGCAGVGANVTGVDSCSDNYACYSTCCPPENTATTGGCPLIVILPTPTSPCCCAGDNLWTRGCPVISGVLRSEARRISAVNSYVDSERNWREENTLLLRFQHLGGLG